MTNSATFQAPVSTRRSAQGRVYQQVGTGRPYTVVVVDGEEIVVFLERANRALPVTI